MKINKKKFYNYLFATTILLQIFLPSFRTNILIQLGVLALFLYVEKVVVSRYFLKFILPLIYLFLLGFLGTFIHKYNFINILKDIFHFIKPILGLSIGYLISKKINDLQLTIRTLVICALISALIHIISLLVTGNLFSGSLSTIREFSRDSFLELFALFFLGFYRKFQNKSLFQSKLTFKIIFLILLFSNVLYFSRTMIVTAFLIAITLYGYTVINKSTLKILVTLTTLTLLLYVYLFSIKIERDKPGIDAFLYKVKIAPAEIFETNINREDHKDLWDHWRGYEALRAFDLMKEKPSSFVFGCGHGSLVNLKFFAPLTGNVKDKGMKYISELHNGYIYIYYKTGMIGFLIYIFLLFKIYRTIYGQKRIFNLFISAIGLTYFFTTLTITGIYNSSDIIIFILGGLIAFSEKENQLYTG